MQIFAARVDNLHPVQEYIETTLAAQGCPEPVVAQVSLACEELFVNIASYAYGGGEGEVGVSAGVDGGEAVVSFRDRGVPFNPLEQEDPDVTLDAAERDIGGLGIFMAKQILDSLEYTRDGDANQLVARKRIDGGAAEG